MSDETSDPFAGCKTVEQTMNDGDDGDDEWVDLDPGEHVRGEVVRIQPHTGQYDQVLYEFRVDVGETVLMFGKGGMDHQIEQLAVEAGDVIVVQNTGEEFTTSEGYQGVRYRVGIDG